MRSLALPAALVAILTTTLIMLGNWQMERLAWKEALIESVAERPLLPPIPPPPLGERENLDTSELEYRPLRLSGRYVGGREALVFTNLSDAKGPAEGPGYWVVTPFALESGGTVLVNRGFVPQDRRGADQHDPAPEGTVAITGLLRPDDTRNWFTPEDRPADGLYFARSIGAIGTGLQAEPPLAPFTIDLLASETPPSGFPQAGETRMAFTNNHLGYAFTWYGLAAALVAVFATSVWGRLRGRPAATP